MRGRPGEELCQVHRAGDPGKLALAVKEEQRRVSDDPKAPGEVRKRRAVEAHYTKLGGAQRQRARAVQGVECR
jgi:hypothetical protein